MVTIDSVLAHEIVGRTMKVIPFSVNVMDERGIFPEAFTDRIHQYAEDETVTEVKREETCHAVFPLQLRQINVEIRSVNAFKFQAQQRR